MSRPLIRFIVKTPKNPADHVKQVSYPILKQVENSLADRIKFPRTLTGVGYKEGCRRIANSPDMARRLEISAARISLLAHQLPRSDIAMY
jgi:hypothetical protein